MERGPCRAARRPSRSPVEGRAQRTGRGGFWRAVQDAKGGDAGERRRRRRRPACHNLTGEGQIDLK